MPAETFGQWQERMKASAEHDRHQRNGTGPKDDCPSCRRSLLHPLRRASRYLVLEPDLTHETKASDG